MKDLPVSMRLRGCKSSAVAQHGKGEIAAVDLSHQKENRSNADFRTGATKGCSPRYGK
jgi:hypothetical protein